MAVRSIYTVPASVLREKAKKVPSIDPSIKKLISDMHDTLQAASGVGLAAPQVGISLRIVVIHIPEEEPIVLINPEIVKRNGEREIEEGCLSVPGYRGIVRRSQSVVVKGKGAEGEAVRIRATDLLAQALEHEIDHLDGIIYTDYIKDPNDLYPIETSAAS